MRLRDVLASLPESSSTKGTLLGMAKPNAPQAEARPRLDESTAAATDDLFPDAFPDSSDFDYGERVVSHTPTHKMFALDDEHSESAFNNRTKAPWESESLNQAARQANIVAKINPRKTQPNLEAVRHATNIELSSKSDAFADEPSDPAKSEAFARQVTKGSKSGERPKLADLLKQVREKRGPFVTPPPSISRKEPVPPSAAEDDFLPSDQELAADLGLSMPVDALSPDKSKDNRMTPFGKARAETVVRALESHGMAAEKTGSGFIRIPTAEILDLIGTGTYRLQVENVVYEPIDEVGIRRLVRTEFLTGDELVSERGGDWIPMRDHAFFSQASAPHDPLTMELEISDAEAIEELFEPPAVLGSSDSSGELFPTIGHLSPDQSAEIELSYAEHSSSEIIDSDVDEDLPKSVDAPLTAELDLDDLDDLEVVHATSPPETPAVLNTKPAKSSSFRPIWLVIGLVAVAGVLVGGVFRSQLFGSTDDSIDPPIAETTPELAPPLVAPTTAAQLPVHTATAAQVVEVIEEVPEVVEEVVPVEVVVGGVRRLSAAEIAEPTLSKEGKTPVLKFSLDGQPVTFIADTGESQRSFRSNLAVAALCRATACGIDFAKTQEAFLPSEALKSLGLELNAAETKVEDVSGIQGALRWDVQGAAQLPLAELTSVWRKWMGLNDEDLDKAVSESESDLVKAIGQERTTALLAQAGQIRVRDLVKQISNVLVLDYLTNNFERFESGQGPTTWNLAVKNGKVVSLDDGGAFQPRASTRIKGRFSWVEKFDKTMFDSIAQLNREAVEPTLLPDATAAERVSLRVFWKQQQAYVDHLKKETLRRPDALFF